MFRYRCPELTSQEADLAIGQLASCYRLARHNKPYLLKRHGLEIIGYCRIAQYALRPLCELNVDTIKGGSKPDYQISCTRL